uniref:Cadherin-23-like n=1 Tax=Crassostrea virginica TaxID=6565 RepID=A0A8B8CBI2_CRAVI|nr:cadherin-23-like [Crassostrea virginica]
MRVVYLFCFGGFFISYVTCSVYENHPPIFDYVHPLAPQNYEGNYTGNPNYTFTIKARVRDPNLSVNISEYRGSQETSVVTLNCTHINNSVTCDVYINSVVDRERNTVLAITLVATSSNAQAPQSFKPVKVFLNDVNDESPAFELPSYQVTVYENHTVGSSIESLVIKAKDPDNGEGGTVTYRIEPSGQAHALYDGYFNITVKTEDASATIFLLKELDYENLTFLQYNIIATDGGPIRLSSSAELLVKVKDVQDKAPVFLHLPYVKSVQENERGVIFTASAIDGDLGIPRKVLYSPLEGRCAKYLHINNQSGIISVAANQVLDRDSGDIAASLGVCFITIKAYEMGNEKPNLTHSNTSFALTIEDINDNAPNFTYCPRSYNGRVPENSTEVSISFNENIFVQDIDQNGHNKINVTVHFNNMTLYSGIEASPSEIIGKGIVLLRVNKEFDYEKQTFVDLVVQATDTDKPSMNSTCTVRVQIIDINDNDPQFLSPEYKFYVPENSCNGTHVGYINATDEDSGDFGNVFYQFSGTEKRFEVDRDSGEIYVATNQNCNCSSKVCENSEIDREKNPVYYLTAVAQDGGGKRTPVSVEIHINDTNDNPPTFRDYETSIKEGDFEFSSGKSQFSLTATDDDLKGTINSQISFCFVDVNDNCKTHTHFNISESGDIMCIKELDYEDLASQSNGGIGVLHLKIKAYDHGISPLYSVVNLTIYVQDINDQEPVFNTSYNCSVKENSVQGTSVLTVSAYDADGTAPNNEMSYFIFSGGSDQFYMDSNSGDITVQYAAKLDREVVSSYNLTVIAIDRGNPQKTGTTNVTVELIDVNDKPPRFLNLPQILKVKENETGHQNYFNFTVLGFDEDIGSNLTYTIAVANLTYTIAVEDAEFVNSSWNKLKHQVVQDYFTITPTGLMKKSPNVDAEVVSRMVLNVTVNDINTHPDYESSSSEQLTIEILDENDNPPIFTKKQLSTGILRSSAINTEVFDLGEYVRDNDVSAINRIHKYTLSPNAQSRCGSQFCVSGNGTVTSNVLFSQKGHLVLNISVSDDAGMDFTQLDIYIIDESQQLSMHFQRQKNDVYQIKDEVLELVSQVLGYRCVFDEVGPYTDENGRVIEFEALLKFHVLDETNKKVLDASFVESILDKRGDRLQDLRNEHGVRSIGALQIRSLNSEENKIKETYILVAVIVLLTVILGIVIYFYIISTTRFKRKLKAATISTVSEKQNDNLGAQYIPGSNQFVSTKNPLLDKEEEVKRRMNDFDQRSLAGSENSLDMNNVEYAKRNHDNDNPIEEKEVIMDLYGEDEQFPTGMNDEAVLLNQVLQQNAQTTPTVKNEGSQNEQQDGGTINESYEIVESTDV